MKLVNPLLKKHLNNLRICTLPMLVFVALAGCEQQKDTEVDNMQLARFYFESGNDIRSFEFLNKEIESGVRKQEAHQLAAELYDNLGYFPQAILHLKSAITLGCEQPCVSALVSAYLGLQKVNLAEQEFDKLTDKETAIAKYQSILINHSRQDDFSETVAKLKTIDLPVARESILLLKLKQGLIEDLVASYDDKVEYTNTEMLVFAKAFFITEQFEQADKVLLLLRLKQKGEVITNEKIEVVELLVKVNLAKNQFAAADQIYKAFLEKYEGSSYVRFKKALNYLNRSDFKSAISEVDALAQAYPESIQIASILAIAQFGKGDYQAVVTVLENFKEPPNDNMLAMLASSYNQLYRSEDTIRLLENTTKSDKLTAILSRAYLIQGNKKQALKLLIGLSNEVESTGDAPYIAKLMHELELFDKIISKFSGSTEYSAEVKYLIVDSYLNLKQKDKARTYIEKQTEGDLTIEMKGYLEIQTGQLDDAINSYKALVAASPVKKSYSLLAKAYLANHDYDLALSTIQSGTQITGQNQTLLGLAYGMLRQKNDLKTKQWLEDIEETHRDYKQVQMLLASYEIEKGEDANAVQRLSSLTGSEEDQKVYYLLAKAHRKSNPTKSLEMLEKSMEVEYSLSTASRLYRYYDHAGDLVNLQRIYTLVENKSGVNFKTASLLFRGYLKLDQPDMAMKLAETLIAQGHSHLGGELIGDLFVLKEDFVAAANHFKDLIQSEADDRLWMKYYKARLKQDLANSGEIFKEIEGKLKQYPDMNTLRHFLAVSYVDNNNDLARQHFEVLLVAFPGDSAVLNNLAWVNLDTNPEKALYYSTLAYQKSGNSSSIVDTHVRALKRNKQNKKAEAILKEKLELSPDNKMLKELMDDL